MSELVSCFEEVSLAIRETFHSPNEMDRNGETANMVDGLFFIGRAIHHLAEVIEERGM